MKNHQPETKTYLRAVAGVLAATSAWFLPGIAEAQTVPPNTPPPPPPPALTAPQQVVSQNGVLNGNLAATFATVSMPGENVLTGTQWTPGSITARLYGTTSVTSPTGWQASLPGPTFVFRQGELLKLNFQNLLNSVNNPALIAFDNNPQNLGFAAGFDDTRDHAPHEISIPNDSNVTNLHVHGLHVDPKQDNVTLLVLPQDRSPGTMDWTLQRFVPNINQWWTRNYQYKIPRDHIPGTYWYHSHKHGSTSSQVENGMAGVLVMRPANDADDYVTGLWNDDPALTHDRVMIIQEITNIGQPAASSGGAGAQAALRSTALVKSKAPGKGKGKGSGTGRGAKRLAVTAPTSTPLPEPGVGTSYVTLNGEFQPQLTLPPGQGERWRFVLAGANHTAAGSIWVGKYVFPATLGNALINQLTAITAANVPAGQVTFSSAVNYSAQALPGIVLLASVDGIPIWNAQPLTPSTPTIGGAGNRFDVLVQPAANATGQYYAFFNYPFPSLAQLASAYPYLFAVGTFTNPATNSPVTNSYADVQARYNAYSGGNVAANGAAGSTMILTGDTTTVGAPGSPIAQNLNGDFYSLGANYGGFLPNWGQVTNPQGTAVASSTVAYNVAPLLSAQANASGKGVSINSSILAQYNAAGTKLSPTLGYQPMPDLGGAGPATAQVLMTLNVQGPAVSPPTFSSVQSLQASIAQYSPAGNPATTKLKRVTKGGGLATGIPAYVAPPGAVDGSQLAVFDRGQLSFDYVDKVTGQLSPFRQFWINGRQFDIDDSVGNPQSNQIIQTLAVSPDPSLGTYNPLGASAALPNAPWTHFFQPASGPGGSLFINPGYYRPVKNYNTTGTGPALYNYDYTTTTLPTYQNVVGNLGGAPMPAPSRPKSGTLEEWLLINNSDLYHPFHIHINPFFVEEVGQLNYANNAWSISSVKWVGPQQAPQQSAGTKSPFGWVVGNWWDVIMLPPHGYVRIKMWVNVPDQAPLDPTNPNSDLVVQDNANIYGSWVFHCHILRHEDRGMMSMVNTVPKGVSLSGTWNAGATPVATIADHNGGLVITPPGAQTVGGSGTFNAGIGNPLVAQPFAGAFNFTSALGGVATGTATFCYGEESGVLALSTGQGWVQQTASGSYVVPTVSGSNPVSLTGNWIDDTPEKNRAAITQTGGTAGTGVGTSSATNGTPAQLTFTSSPGSVWWASGSGAWNAGIASAKNPNLNFGGTVTLKSNSGQNQLLSFAVTQTASGGPLKIVFSNGITWTKL